MAQGFWGKHKNIYLPYHLVMFYGQVLTILLSSHERKRNFSWQESATTPGLHCLCRVAAWDLTVQLHLTHSYLHSPHKCTPPEFCRVHMDQNISSIWLVLPPLNVYQTTENKTNWRTPHSVMCEENVPFLFSFLFNVIYLFIFFCNNVQRRNSEWLYFWECSLWPVISCMFSYSRCRINML